MPFYEIIYETGSNSVANYANDEEAAAALAEQHARARNGFPGGPTGHVAERIKDVKVYDKHPADFGAEQAFSKDVATKTVTDLINALSDENGVVSKTELASRIVQTSEALVRDTDRKPNESLYKMKEKRSLDSGLWEGTN